MPHLCRKSCSLWKEISGHFSVQFSHSVMSNSLQSHGLQHGRLPCPSPTPGAYTNSCPGCQGCHPTISSSVVPFSSCLQSFPALGSFKWVSSSHQVAKVLQFQLQNQSFQENSGLNSFRMDWLNLLVVQGTLQESYATPQFKIINSSVLSFLYSPTPTSTHDYWKTIALTRWIFAGKVMSLFLICYLGFS